MPSMNVMERIIDYNVHYVQIVTHSCGFPQVIHELNSRRIEGNRVEAFSEG